MSLKILKVLAGVYYSGALSRTSLPHICQVTYYKFQGEKNLYSEMLISL